MNLSFSKEQTSTSITVVENIFIYEYLPEAPENAVKVYLYGLFLCQNHSAELSVEEFAGGVKLSVEEVKDIFKYWEEFGLVAVDEEPFSVIYYPVRNSGSRVRKVKAEKYADFTTSLQVLISSRMIGTNEYMEYFNVMEDYNIKPEAMLMIVKYCIDLKGDKIGMQYISKVAKDFGKRGINTTAKIDKELQAYNVRTSEISKVLEALSVKRKPELDDLNLLNKWTKELNFELDNVLYAASMLKKSSITKLDKFIGELYSAKCFDKKEIQGYLEQKKKTIETTVKINKQLGIYLDVLDAEIDTFISKWFSYGYDEPTLLFLANRCFKKGENTLQKMDEEIEKLYNNGFVGLESVTENYVQVNKEEKFIKEILTSAGMSRNPTEWDRKTLSQWHSWNFSNDMIMEAVKLASGKSNPMSYVNAVLSNWKNNDVFSVQDISAKEASVSVTQDVHNAITYKYERLREKAQQVAKKNLETALKNEGFKSIYYELNSLERDLGIAEGRNDQNALDDLQKREKELLQRQSIILIEMNLTAKDLSPIYNCPICKDTGINGDKKCSCYYTMLNEITNK